MAERKQSGKAAEDEEVPAFFKNLGSGSPKPRQKFCGMFCPVEGSSENKTIDFDSLSVGRGSGQVVAQQRDVAHLGPDPQPPYSRQGRRAGGEPSVESGRKVAIRRASGKEALQNVYDQLWPGVPPFFDAARSVRWRLRVKAWAPQGSGGAGGGSDRCSRPRPARSPPHRLALASGAGGQDHGQRLPHRLGESRHPDSCSQSEKNQGGDGVTRGNPDAPK
ncbi:dihydropyrimidinase-related protein 2 isoform X1 [Myotis lucifugus]|uniref:dihydropyrimidinase-related protein 2 isoform X1 n=1 Tax=Myotis lucifugus TaxID=59463 RepID=UPI000CCC4FC6|nr:dihydropyrimidinase-related protein 2 isoform X1 [Myotis lucifugus]